MISWSRLAIGAAAAFTVTSCSGGGDGPTGGGGGNPAPVASVAILPSPATVVINQTTQLSATLKDVDGATLSGRTVTWSSANDVIATVNASSGLVTGKGEGSTTITAESEGKKATVTVNVTPVPVATVTVSPNPGAVNVGATLQLSATTKDASGATLTGRTVTWTSSSDAIATVNPTTGLVTGVSAGTATITATSETKTGTTTVTVSAVPVASVSISPAVGSVSPGKTLQLTATASDASGQPLSGKSFSWSSSDITKATVNPTTGLVTGVANGTVTITATSETKSGTATITIADVTAPDIVSPLTVTPNSVDATSSPKTVTLSIHAQDTGGSAGVASVSATASLAGTGSLPSCNATLTSGTALDGTWTCTITVPTGSKPGDWKLSITATDAAGNSRTLGEAELLAAGLPTKFVVTGTADTAPPNLTGLTLSPPSINVTSAAQTVTVTGTVTDNASGVSLFFVKASAPTGPFQQCTSSAPATGTATNGTFSCTLTFPKGAANGDWVLSVVLVDAAFNQLSLGTTELNARGLPTKITVTSATPDQLPPVFQSLTVTPSSVDVSTASKTVTISARLTDANSGVARFDVSAGPAGSTTPVSCSATSPSSGTVNDGVWSCTVTVPARATPGDWLLTVTATDAATYFQTYGPQPNGTTVAFPAGFTTKFTVVRN